MPKNNRYRRGAWTSKLVFPLSVATSIGMFLVLLMGALVTNTESGRGCGDDWPLCNGKFVPAYTIESLIEWSHRFVTGIVGMLVLATLVLVLQFIRRRDARWYAVSIMFFTLVQAAMGAFAVIWPQSSAVLALHFGISLLAFASTTMLISALLEDRRSEAASTASFESEQSSSDRFRWFVWTVFVYCYVVVYLGAYVRHTDAAGGCGRDWPLCDGALFPTLSGSTGVMFLHRAAALLLFAAIAWMLAAARRSGQAAPVQRVCRYLLYIVILQIFSGAFVTHSLGSDWYLLASLIHTVLIAGLFAALTYLSIYMLRPSALRTIH